MQAISIIKQSPVAHEETSQVSIIITLPSYVLQAAKAGLVEMMGEVDGDHAQSRFSTRRTCSREQRKKQLDWLVTNTDDITSQSHSLFACSRE